MKLFLEALTTPLDFYLVLNQEAELQFVGGVNSSHWSIGNTLEQVLPPDLATNIRHVLKQSQKTGEVKKIIYATPNLEENRNRWIRILCIHPPQTKDDYAICFFQDVTKGKELEQENIKFSKAIEQSAHSVIITNPNGETEYVNQHFVNNSGYSFAEIVGKKPGAVVCSGVHTKTFYKELWQKIKKEDSWSGEFCNRKKTGELYWEQATIAAVRDEQGKITNYIAIQADVTEQKKAFWELEKSKNYAEKLNRILGFALEDAKKARLESDNASRAKSEFLANMSHEIRTPMNSLVGMIDLFRETPLNESQKKYLDIMDRSSQMLLNLINDVLDLSRIEAGFIELESVFFNLEDTIDTITDLMSTKAHQKGIDLFVNIHTPTSFIMQSDPVRLRQIFLNLVSNAIKFTDTGSVTISINTIEHEKNRLLVIKVSDTGLGIPKEKMGMLFQKFSQLSNSPDKLYGGSGLGLVITKKIVEKMEGHISVESEANVGSTFTVTIPLKEFRQKSITNEKELQISLGDMSKNSILATTLKEMFPNVSLKIGHECTFCKTAKHCNSTRLCDFFIVDTSNSKEAYAEINRLISKETNQTTQIVISLTHEQKRHFLQESPNLEKHVHFIEKPIKRRELFSLLLGDQAQKKDLKKIESEDLIRELLKVPLRILLVDDSEDNRILMTSFLQKIPVNVEIAENGADALEMSQKGDYDITFMDMQMPIMDGYHAMKEIRGHDKDFKKNRRYIVALSAFAFADEIEHSYQAGCDFYLTKPIKKQKLMEVILLYIKSRNILSEKGTV